MRKGYEILFALRSGRQTLFNVRRSCAQQGKKNIVVLVLSKITSRVQPRLRVSFENLWHVCVTFLRILSMQVCEFAHMHDKIYILHLQCEA